ncbi:hypothetical protein OK074_2707 [Actinobacteria bacterium OK074]|nr:hypothetical protein OK074_2707 [Actinobacteria bacterium OK074]
MTVIAVVNCNTSTTMTETIAEGARAVALPGTRILPLTPTWGVASAEGWFDSFLSAAAVLDLLQNLDQPVDGVVMAGFGEHGREGARELLDVPVVDGVSCAVALVESLAHRHLTTSKSGTYAAPLPKLRRIP